MPDGTGDSTPPKRVKQNAEQSETSGKFTNFPSVFTPFRSGRFEFASERVATMIFHSFGHDEEPPRSRVERELVIDGNRLKL